MLNVDGLCEDGRGKGILERSEWLIHLGKSDTFLPACTCTSGRKSQTCKESRYAQVDEQIAR